MKSQVGAVDYIRDYQTELETIQATFKPREFTRWKPKSDFPELIITVPDKHDELILAPVFDAHLGSTQHDEEPVSYTHLDVYKRQNSRRAWRS